MSRRRKRAASRGQEQRFGIGEWFGRPFANMTVAERNECLSAAFGGTTCNCPFTGLQCKKKGGVCSFQLYERTLENAVFIARGEETALRVLCPNRFTQQRIIYEWVAQTILDNSVSTIIKEVGFLDSVLTDIPDDEEEANVGRIDNILLAENGSWCALEVQAVYFSGYSMSNYLKQIASHTGTGIPFPSDSRRPDYRSSGPKRLMPQLQIKVPTLRRWGKKMAVVVDKAFFASLGPMERVSDVSNCDIIWFVCTFALENNKFVLTRGETVMVTLERAVEGLTAGKPTTLREFERRIAEKMKK